jgi:hypothetical protein
VVTSLVDLRAGDLGFGPIHGLAGAGVGAGQLFLAAGERGWVWKTGVRDWWRKRHVLVVTEPSRHLPPMTTRNRNTGVYTEPDEKGNVPWSSVPNGEYVTFATGVLTAPRAVQGMPGGAEEIDLETNTHWTDEWTFLRPNYARDETDSNPQGRAVAAAAQSCVGTPYDFLTYLAIPLYRRGLRTKRIKEIISGTDTMMCSRLADAALRDAGFHVFSDGRLPGDVTPSELYRGLRAKAGTQVIKPSIGWV